jgi:ribulose 1,5-bisphosphate synthetase/thiazole synthase
VADAFDMVMDPNFIGATDADQGGLGSTGHDAVILSGSHDRMEPLQLLGGPKQPQIYSLDPSIVSKTQHGIR